MKPPLDRSCGGRKGVDSRSQHHRPWPLDQSFPKQAIPINNPLTSKHLAVSSVHPSVFELISYPFTPKVGQFGQFGHTIFKKNRAFNSGRLNQPGPQSRARPARPPMRISARTDPGRLAQRRRTSPIPEHAGQSAYTVEPFNRFPHPT